MNLDDFLDAFDLIDRAETLLRGPLTFLPHLNLRGHLVAGKGGWCEMRIERHDENGVINQTGGEAERLLRKFGVPIWSRRVRDREFIFTVPLRQANWAEYLLATHFTMADSHVWHNPDNSKYAARRGGRPVPAWADQKEFAE